MPSTYSNLKIQLMAAGENNTTWGNVTNVNLGTAIEEAIVGSADVTFASGNVTLTLTDSNATQTARNMRLRCTGTTAGARNLIVPAIEKPYIVQNDCADAITVKNATGTGITVPAGKTMWVYNDGTNVVDAVNHLSSLTLTTALPILQGGTGSNTAGGARTNLGATTVGSNLFTLANPSAITFPQINADNSVSTLAASAFRTAIGATTVGGNMFTLTNPSAITFPRFNADNTVSALDAATFRSAIGAGTGNGSVTSIGMTVPAFLSVTPASISTSGTFAVTLSGTALPVANGGTGVTSSTGTGSVVLSNSPTLVTPTLGVASATSVAVALGAVGTPSYTFTGDTNTGIFSPAADTIAFVEGGTEAMRITSAGDVGIGTVAPNYKFEVRTDGASTFNWVASFNNTATGSFGAGFLARTGVNNGYFYMRGDGVAYLENASANPLGFATNANERMRITSAGDVGIGTVAPQSKFHVSTGYVTAGNLSSTAGSRIIGGDYSGAEHITTFGSEFSSGGPVIGYGVWPSTAAVGSFVSSAAPALQRGAYTISGNNHVWYTGASQTVAVGSAVTMTARMQLDGSGNLGLGTAPSGVRLDVNGSIRTTVGSGGTLSLFETDATRANQLLSGADASGSFINATFSTGGVAVLRLQTANNERMRITATGDVGIGTVSPASRLHAAGITRISDATNSTAVSIDASTTAGLTSIIAQFGGSQLALGSAGIERFRITSTGGITSSDLADAVGYKGIPQNSQTSSYTLALSDMGKHISITTGGVVIPANGSVAFPIGSAVTIFNNSGSNQTISITTDTLRQAGTANTGSRTLAQYGVATVLKVTSTVWVISGAGVT